MQICSTLVEKRLNLGLRICFDRNPRLFHFAQSPAVRDKMARQMRLPCCYTYRITEGEGRWQGISDTDNTRRPWHQHI